MNAQIQAATHAAVEAFHAQPLPEARAALLDEIAARLTAAGDELLQVTSRETSLPLPRLQSELERTVRQLRRFAAIVREGSWVEAVIDHGDPQRTPVPKPDLRRMLRPLGPVVVFGASNFPLAYSTAGGDTASALAAGCPVLVKGHPAHPETSARVAAIVTLALEKLGLHPGLFAHLQASPGQELELGKALVQHPEIKAGGFTGSFAGGSALTALAQTRPEPIPFFAEMGSVNPVFVLPMALAAAPEALANKHFASFTSSVGQMCTCPGLVFCVQSAASERFALQLERLVQGAQAAPMLTESMRRAFAARADQLGALPGVRRVHGAGGTARTAAPVLLRVGYTDFVKSPALHEECFGPATVVVTCANERELYAAASAVPGSLTATLWALPDEQAFAQRLLARLERIAGRVVHGGVPTGVEVCDAIVHSGPWPACSRPDSSSVGPLALRRWCRPVAYQDCPQALLPKELQDQNPFGIRRLVDGRWS